MSRVDGLSDGEAGLLESLECFKFPGKPSKASSHPFEIAFAHLCHPYQLTLPVIALSRHLTLHNFEDSESLLPLETPALINLTPK